MYKNFLVQIRSRRSIFGVRLGGIATVTFEVLVPVLFIGAMCLVVQLPTTRIPAMVFKSWPISDSLWAGKQEGALEDRHAAVSCSGVRLCADVCLQVLCTPARCTTSRILYVV
jgi:hypothetical protein